MTICHVSPIVESQRSFVVLSELEMLSYYELQNDYSKLTGVFLR